MEDTGREDGVTSKLRRRLQVQALAPFACSFARIGLQRWLAAEHGGLGVVLDVALNGAKVMSAASMNPGEQLAISLRLPDQTATMNVDATVRWGKHHTFGLELTAVSQLAKPICENFSPVCHTTGISPFLHEALCRPSPYEVERNGGLVIRQRAGQDRCVYLFSRAEEKRSTSDRVDRPRFARLQGCK